jgi:threonine/homoserine/homoserine lactone efflux protein
MDGRDAGDRVPAAGMILAFLPFLVSMSFTPGPNNIMVASSGVNFGFRATIPHMVGIAIGVATMMLLVGFGLGQLFLAMPLVHQALKLIGTLYLLYLAWRIATATSVGSATRTARPLTVLQGAAFQCVNIKGWIIAVSAITTYTVIDASLPLQICQIAALSALMALASVVCWTMFGQWLRQFLNTSQRLRWFNYSMAILLVASIVPTLQPTAGPQG